MFRERFGVCMELLLSRLPYVCLFSAMLLWRGPNVYCVEVKHVITEAIRLQEI
jgi:hypothetical protein